MENDPQKILEEVAAHVLESMAFMFADVVERDEIPGIEDTYFHAQIEFAGHSTGKIGLVFLPELAADIAVNVLGIEPEEIALDDVDNTIEDAVAEVLNVVCGQFLTSMFGDKPVFELSVPHVSKLDSKACNDLLRSSDTVAFMIDDAPMLGYVKLG
ncbi:MAG: chemotaxis protein CheX [Deltaproteobacteria bacterium]|nr:chemotaxis protein CheX [Deltaproteobacteria bacterium]